MLPVNKQAIAAAFGRAVGFATMDQHLVLHEGQGLVALGGKGRSQRRGNRLFFSHFFALKKGQLGP